MMTTRIFTNKASTTIPIFPKQTIIISLALFFNYFGFAQTQGEKNTPPLLTVSQCVGEPMVDGLLNDSVWIGASRITTFFQREPNEGLSATESTNVAIAFDTHNLYIGIRCYDSKVDQIVANEMRRDVELDENDRIEIILDTFNDGRNAFFFSTNPLGGTA